MVIVAHRETHSQLLEIACTLKESRERIVACRGARLHSTKVQDSAWFGATFPIRLSGPDEMVGEMVDADPRVAVGVGRSVVTACDGPTIANDRVFLFLLPWPGAGAALRESLEDFCPDAVVILKSG